MHVDSNLEHLLCFHIFVVFGRVDVMAMDAEGATHTTENLRIEVHEFNAAGIALCIASTYQISRSKDFQPYLLVSVLMVRPIGDAVRRHTLYSS